MSEAAVAVSDISKRYDRSLALNGVSAAFPTGSVVGLLGHNGAGKSTLIKLILGLIRPTAGRLEVFGQSPNGPGARQLRSRIGYLPENVAFYGNLSGREVIHYLARLKRVPATTAIELLEKTGLTDAIDRRVSAYSKGMRQRLGLAQCLLGSPELLLLDEPTTGLDPMATQDFYRLVGELRAQGRTVIISSHLLSELEPHLDHAVILGRGRVLAQGDLAQLCADAGLPVSISVRLNGRAEGLGREPWLHALNVTVSVPAPDRLELDVPAEHKMTLVRRLMGAAAITDIEVREPSLSRLYALMGAD